MKYQQKSENIQPNKLKHQWALEDTKTFLLARPAQSMLQLKRCHLCHVFHSCLEPNVQYIYLNSHHQSAIHNLDKPALTAILKQHHWMLKWTCSNFSKQPVYDAITRTCYQNAHKIKFLAPIQPLNFLLWEEVEELVISDSALNQSINTFNILSQPHYILNTDWMRNQGFVTINTRFYSLWIEPH